MPARYILSVKDSTDFTNKVRAVAGALGIALQEDDDSIYALLPPTAENPDGVKFPLAGSAIKSVTGAVSGLFIAAGQDTTTDANDTIVTGILVPLIAVTVSLASDPVIGCTLATADLGDQDGAPDPGSFFLKTWKPTSSSDTTPIAATTFSKKVNWIAVGMFGA